MAATGRGWDRTLVVALLASCAAPMILGATPAPPEVPGGPAATPTPSETPTQSPTTPVSPPTSTPSPDPAYPPLRATVGVSDWFGCDRVVNDACFSDVDARELRFVAEFDGARVTDSNADGPVWWSLELPGTAMGIGPGGSVRARIIAVPAEIFRVLDVECMLWGVGGEEDRRVPATVEGNGVVLEFEVAPTDDDPMYHCTFLFDPTGVPRFPPDPTPPRAPLTAFVEAAVLEGPLEVGRPLRLLSGWRFEPDFGDATIRHSRPTTGGEDHSAFWDLDLADDSTRSALTVVPRAGLGIRSVDCFLDDSEAEWPTTLVGNTVTFELVPAATWCRFVTGPALPATDLAAAVVSGGPHDLRSLLAVVPGLLAGLLVLGSRRRVRS